jgi:putative phosphoesterase
MTADVPARPVILGIVADTHVPDRVHALHPELLRALRATGVEKILHAGDVCSRQVIRDLEQVAPVIVVGGNRDLFFWPPLASVITLDFYGVELALMHGHGGFWPYWTEKLRYIRGGYNFTRFQEILPPYAPQAKVFVFGHTHRAENVWIDGRLYFNPGSAAFGMRKFNRGPSFGVLRIFPSGKVDARIVPLRGWTVEKKNWVKRVG